MHPTWDDLPIADLLGLDYESGTILCNCERRRPGAKMKVFISWSGERSQILGQALRDWLPITLHFVEPWLSQSDIDAGERWTLQVSKELEASNFGIICVTRENIESPWLLFEAGALAKSMQEGKVIPLLLDIDFKDISGPLSQFQAKKIEKSGINDLVIAVNRLYEHPVPDARLSQLFNLAWPSLEEKVSVIPKSAAGSKRHRPQQEILEELVAGIRGLDLRFRESMHDNRVSRRRRSKLHPMLIEEALHDMKLGRQDPIRFLVLSSFFRDDFPWIYELGVDAYRASLDDGNPQKQHEARRRLFSAIRLLRRGPLLEVFPEDKEAYIMFREIERLFENLDNVDPSLISSDKVEQKTEN